MGRHTIISWRSNSLPLDWTGWTAVIVGSGPSAVTTPISLAQGLARVIVLNSSWRLAEWADVLYGTDGAWWFHHKGVPEFKGRKITSSPTAAARFGLDIVFAPGNNSGLRAIRLAEKLNAKRILLVGFDMHMMNGAHWHGPHIGHLHTPGTGEMKMWRDEMEPVGKQLLERGVKIINCTIGSALKCFPIVSFEKALLDGDDVSGRANQSRHSAVS